MEQSKLQIFSRAFFIFAGISLIVYIAQANIAPLGMKTKLSSEVEKDNIKLVPLQRVQKLQDTTIKIIDDVVYFSTDMQAQYESAHIKVTFKNDDPSQNVYLGFQDQDIWHYDTKLIDSPILNNLNWDRIGSNPTIYQKVKKYNSYEDFLKNPPLDSVIGTYDFDDNLLRQKGLDDYKPSDKLTVINTPLRGKVVFYTYISNEWFKLWVKKQDLNNYQDPDVTTIKIYKQDDVVYTANIDDDGIRDGSGKVLPPQETYIQNPGPGLPEPGVYKVVIDAGGDTIIRQIKTNMHKIVFASPIFPISNHEVYPNVVDQTTPNKLYSDALVFQAITYHPEATQSVKLSNQVLNLTEAKKEEATVSAQAFTEVNVPKSDVVLKGFLGYFAFDKTQFFKPSAFKLFSITKKEDTDITDYVISNYQPNYLYEGRWKVVDMNFDLKAAISKKGKLSWIIKAPGLKDNKRSITIKKIEIELTKKPWF
ncbi:hypothetical protein HY025_03695 [Candidatus Daviesbacteria bacterium]|nr:hypothetical protein [Candidatus Daviesbacteria bacterium]